MPSTQLPTDHILSYVIVIIKYIRIHIMIYDYDQYLTITLYHIII